MGRLRDRRQGCPLGRLEPSMRLPRGLVNVVWSAVFLLALPLARAQEMASSVSDSSVEAAASAPTCWPSDSPLSCAQLCLLNGYPSCDYCNTPCAPTCRPANQGGLQCMQLCMNNGYPSCNYCNTPCASSALLQDTEMSTALACQ